MSSSGWTTGCMFAASLLSALGCNHGTAATSDEQNENMAVGSRMLRAAINDRASSLGGKVEIARASNARYIGPLPTQDGRHLRSRVLLRSGHLALVNDEGYAEMVRLGIRSVIDFRSKPEGRAAPDAPWVKRGTRHLTVDLPEILPTSAEAYVQMLSALEPMLPKVFGHLAIPHALPALFHCGTGRGRACAGMAVVLLALGVDSTAVANDFANNQEVATDPRWLDGLFGRVGAAGGIDAYLRAHRVAPSDVEALRAQAVE